MLNVIRALVVLVLLFDAGAYMCRTWWLTRYPHELDYGEGILLWQAAHVFTLREAYHPIQNFPYIVFHYPPLYHVPVYRERVYYPAYNYPVYEPYYRPVYRDRVIIVDNRHDNGRHNGWYKKGRGPGWRDDRYYRDARYYRGGR